ncbi:MAG: DUF1080 domain-containing protein [Verrucomicrobiales bacterium]|nr:DUF1080 domain-containing protein [Verrucomicrobiales bacterium]
MNRFLLYASLFTGLIISSSNAQNKVNKSDPALTEGKLSLARLDAIENWQKVFNGKDFTNWQGDTENYAIEDGVLICQAGAKTLETQKEYSDFAFRFEFKLTESGNNGLGIRVPSGGHAAYDGMELQILDHRGERYHKKTTDGKSLPILKPWQVHGSIYGVMPAKTGYLKPLAEWNEQTVICIEDHVKVILNGAVILDAYLDELTPVDFKDHPGLKSRSGHIQFAGHNDHVEFRNIHVADFSPSAAIPEVESDNVAPEGFNALFNGENLDGWKGLAHKDATKRRALKGEALQEAREIADGIMNEHWSVVDGVLTYSGEGQSLCTSKDYGDFEFYIDWKIPPGADSGIYLRGTPQIQIWDPRDTTLKSGEEPASVEDWIETYKTGRNLGSGGLWNNKRASNRPLVNADKAPGEWNTFLIRMVGDRVSIWLNGKLVVDRTELENYWDREGDRDIPLPRADQIELQHHGSALYFKNIFIRELPY